MIYTKEEKEKIYANIEKIKMWIVEKSIEIGESVTVKFDNDDGSFYSVTAHPYKDQAEISGYIGYLYIDWEKNAKSSTTSYIKNQIDYCVKLIRNWEYIKRQFTEKAEENQKTREAINNFKI